MAIEALHPDVFVEETPGVPRITGVAASTPGFLGRSKKGPTRRATLVTSVSDFKERYGDFYLGTAFGYLFTSIEGFFEEGGERCYVARTVGAGAAKASGTLPAYGVGPTAGSVLAPNFGPYNLEPGQTLVVSADAAADETFTFTATQALRAGAASAFGTIVGGETLLLRINDGDLQTITFTAADTTAAAVAARINDTILLGAASVNLTEVDIRADRRGSGSKLEIVGGTSLAKIGHTVGITFGTGNVFDIDSVTATQAATVINATAVGLTAVDDGGKLRLTSITTGVLSSIQVKAATTAIAFGFDLLLHSGSNAAVVNALTINADNEGAWGNELVGDPTRYTTTTTTALPNAATSVVLASVRNVERGDLLLITDPVTTNFAIVHVYAINSVTKTVSFRTVALSNPIIPLPIGSSVRCSTMHRRVTELNSAVLATAIDLPLKQSFGIVEGATLTIDNGVSFVEVQVAAINGNTVRLTAAIGTAFAANTLVATQEFLLRVFEGGSLKETHEFLSMEPDNVQDYVGKRLAGDSNESKFRIEIVDLLATPVPLFHRAPRPRAVALSGGLDGSALTPGDLIGDELIPSGMHLFDKVQDMNRFAAPGFTDPAFVLAGAAYAEGAAHKGTISFYYEAPLEDDTVEELLDYRRFETNLDSSYALLYAPWLKQRDPKNAKGLILVPPTGRVLGRVSDTISRRGVHVAAANLTLRNVLGLSVEITDGQHDLLNDAGVNVIRFFPGQGIRIWGARTNTSARDGTHYQNVRELLNFVKASFLVGMRFAVFQPNDPRLWRAIESTGGSFLSNMWRQGQLFPSDDESRSYFVKCDAETNTLETRAKGQVIAEVGVNPPFPAEFVIFRIGAWDGGTSIEEFISQRG